MEYTVNVWLILTSTVDGTLLLRSVGAENWTYSPKSVLLDMIRGATYLHCNNGRGVSLLAWSLVFVSPAYSVEFRGLLLRIF